MRNGQQKVNVAYPDNNPKTALGITKPSLSKVPPAALIYLALGFMDGARKYGPYNWRSKKVTASIYVDACMRHLLAWFDGEELAEDSEFPHLAHALACIAILVDAKECGVLADDRPPAGPSTRLLKHWTDIIKARTAVPAPPPTKRKRRGQSK